MKFENTEVHGVARAIYSARNPLDSWAKSDSDLANDIVGDTDLGLAKRLLDAGSDSDSKFMRMISVVTDITAPTYWWREADQYKVSTTTNSRSLMHRGMVKDYTLDDFTIDNVEDPIVKMVWLDVLDHVNILRQKYKETKDYTYFRMMRQLMPSGYNYMETWSANYAVLRNMYRQRKNHKLSEWHEFCDWIKTLPYSELITYGID